MEVWPALEPSLLSSVQRSFRTPLHLQAAFDSLEDCFDLVTSFFPDLVDEEVRNQSAILMQWQEENGHRFKRLKISAVEGARDRLHSFSNSTLQDSFVKITETNPLALIEMFSKKRHKKYKEEVPDARARKFETERKKYSMQLAAYIMEAGLPVAKLIATLDQPETAWVHLFAARRANTLKNRVKSWRPFRDWLILHRGYCFPRDVKDLVDFMQSRVDDGCGSSVPHSLNLALGLLEVLGRVPEDEQLSKDPLWQGHIKSWSSEIASSSQPRSPAAMYTVAMVLSLELLVMDPTETQFGRALSWVVLTMLWAALRCDDVQSILPHRMTLTNFGLKVVLGRSKTTGPDKPHKEVAAFIYRTISLTGNDWLGTGYNIWENDPFNYKRDYLVMKPVANWDGVRQKFIQPSELSSLIRKLLSSLKVPRRVGLDWTISGSLLLLPDGLESHFTGHSPRNFLTSIAALLGFPKDMRAYLGRWLIGMTAAEGYVRTARQVVYKIQKAVNRSIVTGRDDEYFEDEAIDSLCKSAELSGANPARIRKRHVIMNNSTGRMCLGGFYPTLDVHDDGWDIIHGDPDDESNLELDLKAREIGGSLLEKTDDSSYKYFVTVSRRVGHRRLHLTGCFVKPSNCCEVRLCNSITMEEFDSVCRACKKKMLVDNGKETADESSSTASSSSTNASANPPEEEDM